MIKRKSFAVLSCLIALLLAAPLSARADDIPEELPEKIKEKLREMPEPIREKLVEEIKKRMAAKATEESSDDAESTEATEEKEGEDAKKEDDDQKKQAEKSPEDAMSERVKKLKAEMQKMETEFDYKVAQYKQDLADQRLELEKLKLNNQLADQIRDQREREQQEKLDEIKKETELLVAQAKLKKASLEADLAEYTARKAVVEAKISATAVERQLENVILTEDEREDEPFKDGILYVSDRRIELNDVISRGTAKYVCDRIDYFNNQSEKPIFLIIDYSPGGSGMEGLQIVQAIQNSRAPVHVVVKRFAASMAAIITTLADHSYAYPDAILLHHQASALVMGNTAVMKDDLERIREMSRRLVGEVAEKIGLESEEEFVKLMYENRASGDWDLFADEAVKQEWVDHVVHEIREEGLRKRPSGARRSGTILIGIDEEADAEAGGYQTQLVEQRDDKGRPFVRLPRLAPVDAWFLYNPDGYYR